MIHVAPMDFDDNRSRDSHPGGDCAAHHAWELV